jgi:hypothetical protein
MTISAVFAAVLAIGDQAGDLMDGGLFALMSVGGLLTLYRGFRRLRDYKMAVNTPVIPIRSTALGFVKVCGRAESNQLVEAPFSRKPCCFYMATVEKWHIETDDRGRNHEVGEELTTDLGGSSFFLSDDTGKIVIDASKILQHDLQVPQIFAKHVEVDFPNLVEYLKQHGCTTSGRFRVFEWAVLPGDEYVVVGNCAENPDTQTPADRYLVGPGDNVPFTISPPADKQGRMRFMAIALIVLGGVFSGVSLCALAKTAIGLMGNVPGR